MQNEGVFWRSTVKPQLDKLNLFYRRIESPLTPGFCDTVILHKGYVSLIELKSKETLTLRFGLHPLQERFIGDWNNNGGYAFILTRIGAYIHLIRTDVGIPKYPTQEDVHKLSLVTGTSRVFDWSLFLRYMYLSPSGQER